MPLPRLDKDTLIASAARFGYAARAFVYLFTGLLAFFAAWELRRTPVGAEGALAEAGGAGPLGTVWLIAAGCGLLAFAGWRTMQAVFDADRLGGSREALLRRAGKGVSALVHVTLAVSAFELLDALGDVSEDAEARAEAARMLALPFGGWLLFGAAAAVGIAALGNAWKGGSRTFDHELKCVGMQRRWAVWLGRVGYLSRGAALAFVAAFLTRAALTGDASEARSLGGALAVLEAQPGGSLLLTILAFGFGAFGAYGLAQARFRRIRAPESFG